MSEKVCNKCGQEQGLNAFPKVKGKGGKTYYRNTCKNCRRDYDKAWKNANTEHVKQWRKKHYQENREKILSRVAIWQAENKEHKFAYQREWYLLNRDERLAKQKKMVWGQSR